MATPSGTARPLYIAGLVQGVALVVVAASSGVLRERASLSDPRYGLLFAPQMALAALGAFGSGTLRAADPHRLLVAGYAALGLAPLALLAALRCGGDAAFGLLLVATSLLGLAAGITAAALNAWPQALYPSRGEAAVVAMHAVMGLGLAGGPLLVSAALGLGWFEAAPLLISAACFAEAVVLRRIEPPPGLAGATSSPPRQRGPAATPASGVFRLFVAAAFLYGAAEATYANWAVLYLREEKGLTLGVATLALAAFWLALSAGRVTVFALLLRVPAERVFPVLPLLMAGASLLLPAASTPARALLLFALAGLGCSAIYPLVVGLACRALPLQVARVSALLYAALVSGIAGGSFLMGALRASVSFARLYRMAALAPALVLVAGTLALRSARSGGGGRCGSPGSG